MEENARPGRARRSAAASLGLILLLVPVLAAQDKPLTLDEAVRLALERNERSKSNQESVLAANARVQSARSFFFPAVTSTSTYTRRAYEVRRLVGDSEVVISRYNALAETLGLNMVLIDVRSLSGLAAVKAQRNADVAAAAENQRQLAFEVSQAFLATLGVDQVREAAQRRFDYASQNLEAAKARYAAGLVSVNDVTRAELEYATAEVGVTQDTGQLETDHPPARLSPRRAGRRPRAARRSGIPDRGRLRRGRGHRGAHRRGPGPPARRRIAPLDRLGAAQPGQGAHARLGPVPERQRPVPPDERSRPSTTGPGTGTSGRR